MSRKPFPRQSCWPTLHEATILVATHYQQLVTGFCETVTVLDSANATQHLTEVGESHLPSSHCSRSVCASPRGATLGSLP